jgi:uncharacterized RDD family membrane protein YckC
MEEHMIGPAPTGATPPPPQPPQVPPPPQAPPQPPPPPVTWAPQPRPGPAPGVEWAGYGERFVAYLVDGLVIALFVIAVVLLVGGYVPRRPVSSLGPIETAATLISVVALFLPVAYFPFFWARNGQTPGMRLFGLRLVRDLDGGKVGVGAAIVRLIGLWVSGAVLYLGFVWIFIDRRRRGWHDLFAGTVMIKDPTGRR